MKTRRRTSVPSPSGIVIATDGRSFVSEATRWERECVQRLTGRLPGAVAHHHRGREKDRR
jgi:hypothetical protein